MNPTALITGASRGIGKEIARELAKQKYDLFLTCIHSFDLLTALQEELESTYFIKCSIFKCDMSNHNQVFALFDSIKHLDVLINNAGISHIGLLHELNPTEWDHIIKTNLNSCFYTSKYAIPLMLQHKKGNIINISSIWGNIGASMEVAYSTAKGGMNSFTKALAKELAPSNISVNAIACGVIDTDMNACFTIEEKEHLIEEIPANKMGTPSDVATLVSSILNAPSYLTGQIITLDGGLT
ncbi:MAG: elongation factor P 5-aminopentanone reductase [Lachnospiraceae bacterium]